MDQAIYLPLRSTFSLLGPLPPLCLLLAIVCLQQQWTTLCLCLVCILNFPLRLNLLLCVLQEVGVMIIMTRSSNMIHPVTRGQLRGG